MTFETTCASQNYEPFPWSGSSIECSRVGRTRLPPDTRWSQEVVLENGVTGCMFGGDETHYQKDITALINGEFRSMLLGQELPNVERMWVCNV